MVKNAQGQYAGLVTRGMGFGIDIFVMVIVLAVTAWLTESTLSLLGIDIANCSSLRSDVNMGGIVCNSARLGLIIFTALFPVVYALFFWTIGGQTPGMALTGIRVVRMNGKPMSLLTSFRRVLGFVACIFTLGIGFLIILTDNQRQGLLDMFAGTCVIYTSPIETNESTLTRARAFLNRNKTDVKSSDAS